MRYRKFYMSATMAILTIFFGYFVKIPIHAEDSGYTVTIPTAISYSAVNAGRINETTPYNVKVDGTLADSKAVQLTADTNSGHLTAKGGETLSLSVKQNKSTWAPDETTGDGTTSSDSATVSGTAKTAGEYNGTVLYTSNVIANTKQYTASFDANGGSTVSNKITKVGGQALGTLPTATRTGYEFLGWYTKKDGGVKINNKTSMHASKIGITYYAHWEPYTLTIEYNLNGGHLSQSTYHGFSESGDNLLQNGSSNHMVNLRKTNGTTEGVTELHYGDKLDLLSPQNESCLNISRTGYYLRNGKGWNTSASGSGTSYGDEEVYSVNDFADISDRSAHVKLYANWTPVNYTITFNSNSGAGTMANQVLTYDKDTALKANSFTKDGYAFIGWNTKADGTGTSYADKASVKNLATSGTVTLYAQWTKVYTIDYDLDGGKWTDGTTPVTTYTQRTDDFTLPIPQKDGYGFAGWTTDNNATHNANEVIAKGSTGNRSYTAVWSQDMVSVVCEDWTVDYNDAPYSKIGTVAYTINVADGSTIDSSVFGTSTTAKVLTRDPIYYKSETKTVTKADPIIHRYWKTPFTAPNSYGFYKYDGGKIKATFDAKVEYCDAQGNVLHTDNYTNVGPYTSASIWYVDKEASYPDGIKFTVLNITPTDSSYKLSQTVQAGYVFTSDKPGSDMYTIYTDWDVTKWDEKNQIFARAYWQHDVREYVAQKTYIITSPDNTTSYVDVTYDINHPINKYKNGTLFKQNGDLLAKPGWIASDKNECGHYWGGGYGKYNARMLVTGQILDAPICIQGDFVWQDAYGIRFDSNGGAGSMDNICISNIAADDDRKLTANTFTKQNMTFQGWATSQEDADKSIVTYKDNAVMPIDFGSGSTSTADRKYTCKMVTLYAVWK